VGGLVVMSKKPPSSTKVGLSPSPQAIQMLTALLMQGQLARCEQEARIMTEQFVGHAFGWSILGVCLAQMGRFSEAVAPMQKAVSLQASNAGLHNNLGNILSNLGRSSEAEECFRRVLALQPDSVEALNSLGTTLNAQGRFSEAEANFRCVLALQPDSVEAHFYLGNILVDLGRAAEAEGCFRRVLALKPDDAQALNNLGNALSKLGRFDEAEACYRSAVALKPEMALAYLNLGSALKNMGRPREAETNFRRALVLHPDLVEARFLLGNVLIELQRLGEAEACLRRVLELKPDYAEAHGNLGSVLESLDRSSEAEACFRRELELNPDDAKALHNLGTSLCSLNRFSEAEACYRSAVALKPDYAYAYGNLGSTLSSLGRFEEAESCYRRALALKPDYTEARSNLLFSLNYRSDAASEALHVACEYGQSVSSMVSRRYTEWLCEASPKRLRVGIVSGDLCQHVVSSFLENILREIDPEKIEIIAYPTWLKEDHVSQRLRAHLAAWRPVVGLTDETAAARIHADGVHVLIDLSGHTSHNRLPMFAYKPAPVQVSWLGYFATTGVPAMDYLIADPWTLPETEEAYFTEKIWRLPETRLCFTPPNVDVPVTPLSALTNGYITFGCFNNLTKINDGVVALWSRVLTAVPESRLLLKSRQLKDASVRQGIIERFAAHGVDAGRLILEKPAPREEYLAAYQRVDISLDPFPYPGGTVTAEGLWMGVPVLTLAGEHFLSRQGVGLLMNTGLSEWVATDPDDYVARAVSHAGDLQGLAALRASLRDRFLASPICDAKRFARNFEQALEGMWGKNLLQQFQP
jgi:protein O-GlcNAc transferase